MQKLNRNHLKLIACATMLVDHVAQALGLRGAAELVLRGMIGRIAFPLFGFLLVEGLFHTRSRWKYLLRIAVLAVLSEVPYDLLFHKRAFYWENQNVLFLLGLALLMLSLLERIRARGSRNYAVSVALQAVVVAGAAAVAMLLCFDYDIAGVLMLFVIYLVGGGRNGDVDTVTPAFSILLGVAALCLAMFFTYGTASPGALLAAVPAFFYNRTRGKLRAKYAFYLFYPLHILVLLLLGPH